MTRFRSTYRSNTALAAVLAAAVAASSTATLALTNNNWGGTSGSYNTAGNWNNNNVPNSTDQANIFSSTVTLTANSPTAGGILVAKVISAPTLNTNGFKLTCSGTVQVDNTAVMHLGNSNSGASLQTSSLTITNGSLVDMTSAAVLSASNAVSIDGPSELELGGTANATNSFTDNGILNTLFNSTINTGTFTFAGTSNSTATLYLNGNSLTINATNFSMGNTSTSINAATTGSHLTLNNTGSNLTLVNANITLGDSAHLTMPGGDTWLFGNIFLGITAGSVNLNGGSTAAHAAVVDQYAYYESLVNVSGFASMVSGEFDGGSVTTIATNSTLSVGSPYFRGVTHAGLFGDVTYTTVAINGNGTMNWSGDTGIGYSNPSVPYTAVNVNASTLNWEGTSGANATLDIQNGELNIYSTSIQNRFIFNGFNFTPTNAYDGNMTIEGGAKLNVVNAAWTMFGSLTLGPGAIVQGQTLTFAGGGLPLGTYSLYPSNNGGANPDIQAPVVFGASSVVYMGFTGGLQLDGNTTWAGGTIISASYVQSPYGVVVQNGNATVTSNTTLFCNTYDMDGSSNNATWTINANTTLTQQAWYLTPGDLSVNLFHSTINLSGTLDMETHIGQWTLAGGTINMTGTGSAIIQHDKLILGSGNTIGTINVTSGATGFIFGGIESAATTVAGGNVINNNGGLVIQSYFTLDPNSVLTKTGTFDLEIEVGTVSMGVGSVFNVNNGNVNFQFGISGAPNLTLNISGGPGGAGLVGFDDVSHLNTLHIQSGGIGVIATGGNHSMQVTTLIIDGGASPTGGFSITDQKVITQAAAGQKASELATLRAQVVWGQTHLLTGIMDDYLPAGYGIAVIDNALLGRVTFGGIPCNANSILISQELLGDANVDGKVDLTDLSTILNNFGATTSEWTSGNFDGTATINLTDLSDVLNNFGKTNANAFAEASGGGAIAAVPEPASMAALLLAAPMLLRRRKR